VISLSDVRRLVGEDVLLTTKRGGRFRGHIVTLRPDRLVFRAYWNNMYECQCGRHVFDLRDLDRVVLIPD